MRLSVCLSILVQEERGNRESVPKRCPTSRSAEKLLISRPLSGHLHQAPLLHGEELPHWPALPTASIPLLLSRYPGCRRGGARDQASDSRFRSLFPRQHRRATWPHPAWPPGRNHSVEVRQGAREFSPEVRAT